MKNLLLILCCFIVVSTSKAQMNSEILAKDSVLYLTPEQEAFMIDKETKGLFKMSPLAYERKLTKGFSLNFEFQAGFIFTELRAIDGVSFNLGGDIELRNYWKLPKLIKSGKQANNLSSDYYGIGYGFLLPLDFGSDGISVDRRKIYAMLGTQKRFLNYGYLDYGVRLSYSRNDFVGKGTIDFDRDLSSVSISSFFNAGFAFGKKYSVKDETKCPIFRCNLDMKSMFKINYRSLLRFTYGETLESEGKKVVQLDASPNISYERKIGSSAFSINQDLEVAATLTSGGLEFWRANYSIGVRYYNRLKRKIQSGRSGNNLSGLHYKTGIAYTATGFNYYEETPGSGDFVLKSTSGSNLNIDLGLGYQKTVLSNYYFDIGFSYRMRVHTFKIPENKIRTNFDIDIAVGKYF